MRWDRSGLLVGLLQSLAAPGSSHHLQISQEEFANLVGLSRQRCNHALSHCEAASLVRIEYGGITILDLDGLSELAKTDQAVQRRVVVLEL